MSGDITDFEKQLIHQAYYRLINVPPREIEKIVGTDLGPEPGGPTHLPADGGQTELLTEEQRLGRLLVRARRKKREELVGEDYAAMRDAVNFIRSSETAKVRDDAEAEQLRRELLIRGYDPGKKPAAVPAGD